MNADEFQNTLDERNYMDYRAYLWMQRNMYTLKMLKADREVEEKEANEIIQKRERLNSELLNNMV